MFEKVLVFYHSKLILSINSFMTDHERVYWKVAQEIPWKVNKKKHDKKRIFALNSFFGGTTYICYCAFMIKFI